MNLLWKNITEDLCQAKELITQQEAFVIGRQEDP